MKLDYCVDVVRTENNIFEWITGDEHKVFILISIINEYPSAVVINVHTFNW